MTIIEINADYLCLVILGDKTTIDELVSDIKEVNPSDPTEYMSVKIDNPIANKCFELSQLSGKNIVADDGAEKAQCYTYADGYHSQLYMLMSVQEDNSVFKLGYPTFDLGDEEFPEMIIENWFKKRVKKMPSGIKKNMKPINIVGVRSNILVVATKIKNKKKKPKLE
jgi:hypothetical protein